MSSLKLPVNVQKQKHDFNNELNVLDYYQTRYYFTFIRDQCQCICTQFQYVHTQIQ